MFKLILILNKSKRFIKISSIIIFNLKKGENVIIILWAETFGID